MKINGEKFETRNEKAIPIIRPDKTFFFIAESINDMKPLYAALDKIEKEEKVRPVVGGKPGQKREKIIDNAVNRANDTKRYTRWSDGLVIFSLKWITKDQIVTTEADEPEEGWGDTPAFLRFTQDTVRVKYPIEWETVNFDDPKTWSNWRGELRESLLNEAELNRISNGCYEANSLSEAAVQIALDDFLALPPVEAYNESILQDEPLSSQSGEPVADLESSLQA